MTDQSRQVLDEWSQWIVSPCKRLLSAFPSLQPVIDWFLKWSKSFYVSCFSKIPQHTSAIIWLSNFKLFFENILGIFFLSVGFGVTNFPLKLDFWIGKEIYLFILVRSYFMFSLATEPTLKFFSYVKMLFEWIWLPFLNQGSITVGYFISSAAQSWLFRLKELELP